MYDWEPTERRNIPGYVYIFRGDNGLHKIGSTKHITRRMWEVSHYTGVKLELFFCVKTNDMNFLEKKLHKHFKDKRVYNEWFYLEEGEL